MLQRGRKQRREETEVASDKENVGCCPFISKLRAERGRSIPTFFLLFNHFVRNGIEVDAYFFQVLFWILSDLFFFLLFISIIEKIFGFLFFYKIEKI